MISRNDDPRLAWLRLLVFGYILIWFIQLHTFILVDVYQLYGICPYTHSLYTVVTFIFFNMVAYVALSRPDIFSFIRRYHHSALKERDKQRYERQLLACMEKERVYLDSAVTLQKLARKLHVPAGHLSQVINESMNSNFNDFINRYRIEYSKTLLLDRSVVK